MHKTEPVVTFARLIHLTDMTSFWILLLAMAVYGAIHSLLAAHTVKAAAERVFGAGVKRWYRLAYNLVAGVTLLPVLALAALLPDRLLWSIPMPWVLLTLAVQAAAGLGMLFGLRQTGTGEFLGLEQVREPAAPSAPPALNTGGLYRLMRHPIYSASMLILWLLPMMTLNLLALNVGITLYFIVGSILEERKLLKEFGPAYADYRRRTPMFVPKFW